MGKRGECSLRQESSTMTRRGRVSRPACLERVKFVWCGCNDGRGDLAPSDWQCEIAVGEGLRPLTLCDWIERAHTPVGFPWSQVRSYGNLRRRPLGFAGGKPAHRGGMPYQAGNIVFLSPNIKILFAHIVFQLSDINNLSGNINFIFSNNEIISSNIVFIS